MYVRGILFPYCDTGRLTEMEGTIEMLHEILRIVVEISTILMEFAGIIVLITTGAKRNTVEIHECTIHQKNPAKFHHYLHVVLHDSDAVHRRTDQHCQ